MEVFLQLKRMAYIYYVILFKKDQAKTKVFLDFSSKVNTITLAYTTRLDLKV